MRGPEDVSDAYSQIRNILSAGVQQWGGRGEEMGEQYEHGSSKRSSGTGEGRRDNQIQTLDSSTKWDKSLVEELQQYSGSKKRGTMRLVL